MKSYTYLILFGLIIILFRCNQLKENQASKTDIVAYHYSLFDSLEFSKTYNLFVNNLSDGIFEYIYREPILSDSFYNYRIVFNENFPNELVYFNDTIPLQNIKKIDGDTLNLLYQYNLELKEVVDGNETIIFNKTYGIKLIKSLDWGNYIIFGRTDTLHNFDLLRDLYLNNKKKRLITGWYMP